MVDDGTGKVEVSGRVMGEGMSGAEKYIWTVRLVDDGTGKVEVSGCHGGGDVRGREIYLDSENNEIQSV